jgi:hypothetical protein
MRELLGAAVASCWGDIPQEIQQQLFEAAVAAGSADVGDDVLREQIALYLHNHHPRTEQPVTTPLAPRE